MVRACDLRQKEVINVSDGTRLGFIYDVEINFEKGTIEAIIVPGQGRFLGMFGKDNDYVIPWDNIIRIGDDIVLVELERFHSGRRQLYTVN